MRLIIEYNVSAIVARCGRVLLVFVNDEADQIRIRARIEEGHLECLGQGLWRGLNLSTDVLELGSGRSSNDCYSLSLLIIVRRRILVIEEVEGLVAAALHGRVSLATCIKDESHVEGVLDTAVCR